MRSLKLTAFSISLIGLLELLVLILAYLQKLFYPTLLELLLVWGFPLLNAAGVFFLSQAFLRGWNNGDVSPSRVQVCFRRFSLLHLGFSAVMAFWFIWRLAFPAAALLLFVKLAIVLAADRKIAAQAL